MSQHSAAEGAKVFFYHPVKAWELGTILGVTSHANARSSGSMQLIVVKDIKENEKYEISAKLIYQHSSGMEAQCPDNLLTLSELHHSILLNSLKLRYHKNVVYTNLGELIVAVNPFSYTIPWYQLSEMEKYLAHSHLATLPENLQPHSWTVAHRSYVQMKTGRRNHSIIVSGESGSGKTEACKTVLHYLCSISSQSCKSNERKILAELVNKKVQQSSPILEAFGNAKTGRNDNSSRFGKFMEVQFDNEGILVGMKVTPYLLEKSRVVTAGSEERVFHSFYQLLNGAPANVKSELRLKSIRDFKLLNVGGCTSIRGVDDGKEFEKVTQAMMDIGFSPEEQEFCWRILAAILHLQNLEFTEQKSDNSAVLDSSSELQCTFIGTELLRLSGPIHQFQKSLVSVILKDTKGETIYKNLSKQNAEDQRDTICKHLYARLFNWIIHKINVATTASTIVAKHSSPTNTELSPSSPEGSKASSPAATTVEEDGQAASPTTLTSELSSVTFSPQLSKQSMEPTTWIGLLDIYGFEDFHSNSFEQLCINLANEALQRHYTKHMFEKDVEEISREGIQSKSVSYRDNQPCLDLLKAPRGSIFSMLNDASALNYQRGQTNPPNKVFLDEITRKFKPDYQTARNVGTKSVLDREENQMKLPQDYFHRGRLDDDSFTVKHYAADVKYKVKNFVEKNIDAMKEGVLNIFGASKDEIFVEMLNLLDEGAENMEVSPSSPTSPAKGTEATVASAYCHSLDGLRNILDSSSPNWIRCIRPHPTKKQPGFFDGKSVLEQLVASGVLETIEQRQRNFPYRISHRDFVARFAVVATAPSRRFKNHSLGALKEKCDSIVKEITCEASHVQVGKTKVFLQTAGYRKLDELRRVKMEKHVHALDCYLRAWDSKHIVAFLRLLKTAVRIQRIFRLTRVMRKVINAYYAEVRRKIEERKANERKATCAEETTQRMAVAQTEHTDRGEMVREFRRALVPMVATVMKNIQRVENERRLQVHAEEEKVRETFAAIFELSAVQAEENYVHRKKREWEQFLENINKLDEAMLQARVVIKEEEWKQRMEMQCRIQPQKEKMKGIAARIGTLQNQRDHHLQVLHREYLSEVERLKRQRHQHMKDEASLWEHYVGEKGMMKDARHFAKLDFSPETAQKQLRQFYASQGPSAVIVDDLNLKEGKSHIVSYQDYAKYWQEKHAGYFQERFETCAKTPELQHRQRSPNVELHAHHSPMTTTERALYISRRFQESLLSSPSGEKQQHASSPTSPAPNASTPPAAKMGIRIATQQYRSPSSPSALREASSCPSPLHKQQLHHMRGPQQGASTPRPSIVIQSPKQQQRSSSKLYANEVSNEQGVVVKRL